MNGNGTERAADRARDWLRLARAPNLLTAPGDPLAGALLTGAAGGRALAVLAAAVLLYAGGTVLNDALDAAEDRRERPERPIPSGRIPAGLARAAAVGLLALGVLAAFAGGTAAGCIAALLAGTIAAYDAYFKHTPAGPWAMGACRGQSLLMGAAAAGTPVRDFAPLAGAALLVLYTAAVTALARTETARGRIERIPWGPAAAAAGAAAAIALALGVGPAGRLAGGALAALAAALAVGPAERWNIAPAGRRRVLTGRLVGGIPLLQAGLIASAGGAVAALGLAWALLVPLHRFVARRFAAG